MKIKKKLLLGFGLLFVAVLIFGVVSVYYIKVISGTSNVTLKNNYETLLFTQEMRSVLDENDLPLTSRESETFETALKKQENNITEPGEKATTEDLRKAFTLLINPSSDLNQKQQAKRNAHLQLKKIESLNMQAIVLKNNYTHSTVSKAAFYLGSIVFITFLILFILIVNFPGFILNPLLELTNGLDQVSRKNYNTRLNFSTSEEFTRLGEAYNTMAARLSEQEDTGLSKTISAELQIKTLIEETPYAVLGVNEKQEILFINQEAKKILNLSEKSVIGQSVLELSKSNQLMKMMLENNDPASPLQVNQDGKVSYFQQKSIEIVVPNFKPDHETLQIAGYSAGRIRILKKVTG